VLRRDELEPAVLPLAFVADRLGHFGVCFGKRAKHRMRLCRHARDPSAGKVASNYVRALAARVLRADLVEPLLVASSLERGVEPELEDFVSQAERDDASAHREDVRIIVLAREPRREEIVAERRADTFHLVGSDLLALSASSKDDAAVGAALGHGASDAEADRR